MTKVATYWLLITINIIASHLTLAQDTNNNSHFIFEQWDGRPITVYYSLPQDATQIDALIMVLGSPHQRQNINRDQWQLISSSQNVALVFPDFRQANYPKFAQRYPWQSHRFLWNANRKDTLAYAMTAIWQHSEDLFNLTPSPMQIFGHGEAARFLQRTVLFNNLDIAKIIYANPSWFTAYQFSQAFPLGLEGTKLKRKDIVRVLSIPTLVLLGELDTEMGEQDMPEFLNIVTQGPTRISRGFAMHQSAIAACLEYAMTICSRLEVVPQANHSSFQLIPYAMRYFSSNLDY